MRLATGTLPRTTSPAGSRRDGRPLLTLVAIFLDCDVAGALLADDLTDGLAEALVVFFADLVAGLLTAVRGRGRPLLFGGMASRR
ncbi:MAG: hypothetical protein M3400_04305 [Actinomycetota bacterium]|nr:hypothetical protein [Actinomycetota bacterium]